MRRYASHATRYGYTAVRNKEPMATIFVCRRAITDQAAAPGSR
jgi:hypothetical protein